MTGGPHLCESAVTDEGEGPWLPSNWKLRHKKMKGFVGLLEYGGLTVLGGEGPFLLSLLCSLSVVSDFLRPHGLQHTRPPCPSPSSRLLKLMSIESVMPSNHLILYHPLLSPSIFPSVTVFSNESALCIRWPKFMSCQRNSPVPLSCGQAEFRVWPEGGVFWRHRVSLSGESRTVMIGEPTLGGQGLLILNQAQVWHSRCSLLRSRFAAVPSLPLCFALLSTQEPGQTIVVC